MYFLYNFNANTKEAGTEFLKQQTVETGATATFRPTWSPATFFFKTTPSPLAVYELNKTNEIYGVSPKNRCGLVSFFKNIWSCFFWGCPSCRGFRTGVSEMFHTFGGLGLRICASFDPQEAH